MPVINSNIAETINITENGSHDVARYTTANVTVSPNTTSLNVTPSTSAQQLTPTTGVDGFDEVNVSAVTSSIDANIIPENIKKDITILGVTGTHEGGSSGPEYYIELVKDSNGQIKKSTNLPDLTSATSLGNYVLSYAYSNIGLSGAVVANLPANLTGSECCQYLFSNNNNMTSLDMSSVSTISGSQALISFCSSCKYLTSIDFSNLTSVTGNRALNYFAQSCDRLTSISFPSLTTVGSSGLYSLCYGSYIQTLDLGAVTTLPNNSTENFSYMCQSNTNLTSIDMHSLENANRTSAFRYAFSGCTRLTSTNFANLKYLNSSGAASYMFDGCTSLTAWPFAQLRNLNGSYTFQNCTGFTNLTIPYLSNGKFEYMFKGCTNLQTVKFYHWTGNLSNDSNVVRGMFDGCTSLTDVYIYGGAIDWTIHQNNQQNWLSGTTGLKVHLPKRNDPTNGGSTAFSQYGGYPNFGGTNVTLLFDITTMLLCGKEQWDPEFPPMYMREYYRQEQESTNSYTVWTTDQIPDQYEPSTRYYTPGTDGWQVGDSIYEDSACTISVDTIDDIYWQE